jgi:uncharacterized protein with HEPN domain
MKKGIERFDFYLNQLEKLLTEAAKQPDAAHWLYANNARTTVFMLEGLAKIYSNLHDKKVFSEIKESFKSLEDAIGAIDYYDNFAKEFAANKKITVAVTKYSQEKTVESTAKFNALLIENKWLGENATQLKSIRKKLKDVKWQKGKDEVKEIEAYYKEQIDKINAFFGEHAKGFTELETQVHELRRKLRWLSIFPQALRGNIQLFDTNDKNDDLTKYLVPEIVNSPFNKMPDAGENKHLFMLNKPYFLALSWLIAELGKLKDRGLRIHLLCETIKEIKGLSEADALTQTYKMLAPDSTTLDEILSAASEICGKFFAEKIPDKLIHGVFKVKTT